jgi:hypothetical protein
LVYLLPILVCCNKKNLATLRCPILQYVVSRGSAAICRKLVLLARTRPYDREQQRQCCNNPQRHG